MKLSFSINGWDGYSWEDFVQTALEVGMQGIELRGVHGTPLDARGGPFHPHQTCLLYTSRFWIRPLSCGRQSRRQRRRLPKSPLKRR